jgi:hypothetical protein
LIFVVSLFKGLIVVAGCFSFLYLDAVCENNGS